MSKKIKKLICFITLLTIITTALLAVTACGKKTTEEQEPANGGDCPIQSPYYIMYRTNGTVFDIGDLIVELSFGWEEDFNSQGKETDYTKVYFYQHQTGCEHLVRRLEENIFLEKYMIEKIRREDGTSEEKFHYTETVIIPREMFVGNRGVVSIVVEGGVYLQREIRDEDGVYVHTEEVPTVCMESHIYYEIDNNQIRLVSGEEYYKKILGLN